MSQVDAYSALNVQISPHPKRV